MSLPMVTIYANYLNADGSPGTGTVIFTPYAPAAGGGYIVDGTPITAPVINGHLTNPATGLPGLPLINQTDIPELQYEVTEQITGESSLTYVISPTGTTMDLSTAPRGQGPTVIPLYILVSTVGQPNGVASLDSTGHVPESQIPSGSGTVLSVFGRGGAVIAQTGDYTAAQVGADTAGAAATEQARAEAAEALLAPLASPTLTGAPTAPTATALTDDTQIATTAYTDSAVSVEVIRAEAAEASNATAISAETSRAEAAEALLAPKASPTFTGTPLAPTATALADNTQVATTAYTDGAVAVEKARGMAAEALLAPLASPALTGTPTAPTKAALTNNTDIATTAYTDTAVAVETTRAQNAEVLKAPLASPALTGTPTAPTATALTASTQIGTTAYADSAVSVEKTRALAAEGSNTTMINAETARAETAEALLAPLASPALTGSPTAPTKAALTSNTTLATTAYADTAVGVEKTRAQAAETLLAPLASPALTGTPTAPTAAALTSSVQVATTAYTDTAVSVETTRAQAAEAARMLALTPIIPQTASFTATANTVAPCNATSGIMTATLPTAPATGTQVILKKVDLTSNVVTVACGGTDVYNRTGGSTSLTLSLPSQAVSLFYVAGSPGIWYITNDDLPLAQLETLFPLLTGTPSGDMGGTYAAPILNKINGVVLSGTAALGSSLVATGSAAAAWTAPIMLNVLNYGAKGNHRASATGAMNASSGVLTDTTAAAFTAADVGKYISVVGAGAAGVDLSTTIASYQSSTQVTLTATASTTVSAATYGYATDDGPAWNSAIAAAAALGGGTVFGPPGGYGIATSIVPANNVAVIGAGIGGSTFWPFGTTACFYLLGTSGSPLTNFTLAHLAINGSRQVGPYNVSTKGVFITYCSGCEFEDLLITQCVATGMGADFLTNGTVMHAIRAINNGRLDIGGGSGGGASGIGIGTGQHTIESFTVSDCYASGNGRYGIFIESQTGTTSEGMRFTNCYAVGNSFGFGDAGGNGAVWIGCVAYNNTDDGFSIDNGTVGATAQPSGNSLYVGCIAYSNSRYGFSYQPTANNATSVAGAGNHTYVGCKSYSNTSLGFNVNSASSHPVSGMTYIGCDAYSNGASGLQVQNPSNDIKITNCKFNANGQISSTSKTGISIGASVTGLQINGCRIYDDGGTQKQTYAIVIASTVTVTTGAITDNDVRGNLTGQINIAGTISGVVLRGNIGYTPVQPTPAVPATTVAQTNTFGSDATVYVAGATVTAVTVNGIVTGLTGGAFRVPALGTISLTYATGTPTWVWIPE